MVFNKILIVISCVALAKAASVSQDECFCIRNYVPLCASDGETYSNECVFNCAKSQRSDLSIAFHGACDEVLISTLELQPADLDECFCTKDYNPLCASDGRTYSNKCEFGCEIRMKNDLEMLYDGECGEDLELRKRDDDPCICTDEYDPVCGSDHITYGNQCMVTCEQKYRIGLSIQHFGECDE